MRGELVRFAVLVGVLALWIGTTVLLVCALLGRTPWGTLLWPGLGCAACVAYGAWATAR